MLDKALYEEQWVHWLTGRMRAICLGTLLQTQIQKQPKDAWQPEHSLWTRMDRMEKRWMNGLVKLRSLCSFLSSFLQLSPRERLLPLCFWRYLFFKVCAVSLFSEEGSERELEREREGGRQGGGERQSFVSSDWIVFC